MVLIDEVVSEVGQIGLWLQALGIVILLVIIFDIISFIENRKKLKELIGIKKNVDRIERKINRLLERAE